MFVQVNKSINKLTELFCCLGLWQRGLEATSRETWIKLFYSTYLLLLTISLAGGAITSSDFDDSILLALLAIQSIVMSVRFFHIIWNKKEVLELLRRIDAYLIEDEDELATVSGKLKRFIKVTSYFFIYAILTVILVLLIMPFVRSERRLFVNFAFPLDYTNNESAFWIAFVFIFAGTILILISILFSVLIWYILLNCGLQYKVLGNKLRHMGIIKTNDTAVNRLQISQVEKQNLFHRDLIAGVKLHQDINQLTQQLEYFFSNLFTLQISTSGLCICFTIYNVSFDNSENLLIYFMHIFFLFYNTFDIFMAMYFGNEIKLSSGRLSYCLFESNWLDQTKLCKKCVIIFGERLKQPQQLVILKIYLLTLENFTMILNTAYSMFNILKNVK